MRYIRWMTAAAAAVMMLAGSALAADRGTPEEAKALVEKAAAHLKAVGAEKAFVDFENPKSGYQDRDLFVFVYSLEGKVVSGGGVPGLLGRDATKLKDVDGREFGKAIIAAGIAGGGWSEYRMSNPATKKAEPKKTYAVKEGNYILGCGAYMP